MTTQPTNPQNAKSNTATVKEPKAAAATTAATTTAAADGAAAAAPAKPKKEKKEGAVARPRLPKFPDEHVITVLKPNAKREASGLRFNEYKTGMTVKQYVDLMTAPPWNRTPGQVFADLRWDTEEHRKFINIGPTVVQIPTPPAAPAAQAQPTTQAAPAQH